MAPVLPSTGMKFDRYTHRGLGPIVMLVLFIVAIVVYAVPSMLHMFSLL
jgi:hypothetical protein